VAPQPVTRSGRCTMLASILDFGGYCQQPCVSLAHYTHNSLPRGVPGKAGRKCSMPAAVVEFQTITCVHACGLRIVSTGFAMGPSNTRTSHVPAFIFPGPSRHTPLTRLTRFVRCLRGSWVCEKSVAYSATDDPVA